MKITDKAHIDAWKLFKKRIFKNNTGQTHKNNKKCCGIHAQSMYHFGE